MRRLLLSACLALLSSAMLSISEARTVEILAADHLELRRVDGQEFVVITGSPVRIRIDKESVTADRVEYNKTRRTLTLVGKGTYQSVVKGPNGQDTEQSLTGENLVVNLASEDLAGEDVIVTTTQLEIRGEDVERVPGQLKVQNGYFTLCARCGRTPNDYAFRASRVLLYPGDRLVAYDATLLLADAPVLYLPVIVLLLNEPERQPKFEIGRDAIDGYFLRAALPFVIGSNAEGFTLLRYYQNRSPNVGFGVDMRAYDLPLGVRRADVYALANPRPVVEEDGYDLDFRVRLQGHFDLNGTVGGVTYDLTATRTDTGQVTKGVTTLDFSAKLAYEPVDITVNYNDRFGPEPLGALDRVLRRPEVRFDFDALKFGDLTADFEVTLGYYTAASNPLSRTAWLQGPNVSAGRVLEQHTITYDTKPWEGATFRVDNAFVGQYYTTGQRVVDLQFGVKLTQQFTPGTSASLDYRYTRREGISPFRFDPSYSPRRLSGVLAGTFSTQPFPWLTFTASQSYDFVQPADRQPPARFTVRLTPDVLDATGTLEYNFFRGELTAWSENATLGKGPLTFSVSTSFQRATGYQPLSATLAYREPDGSATGSVTATYDLQKGQLATVGVSVSGTNAAQNPEEPFTVTATETFRVNNPQISGTYNVTWRNLVFTTSHTFLLQDNFPEPGEDAQEGKGNLSFGIGNQTGSPTTWSLTYGGPYDLTRGGWTAPTLTGRLSATQENQRLTAQVDAAMPGLDQPNFEITNASLSGQFDLTPRIGISGAVQYTHPRGTATSQLSFRPFNIAIALGREDKPDAYFITSLEQTFQFGPNAQPQPIQPVFTLIVDRCCWALTFEINPARGLARLALTLPTGNGQAIEFTRDGPRLPGTPFGGNP